MHKKITYYSISAFFLISFIYLMFFYESHRQFSVERIAAALSAVASLLFASLALVSKGKNENINSVQRKDFLYRSVNPLFLIIFGILIFLIVYFDIGFNYFGAHIMLYLASGIITFAGLVNFLKAFLKR